MNKLILLPLLGLSSCFIQLSLSSCIGPSHWVEDEGEFEVPLAELRSVHCKTHNGSVKATARAQLRTLKVSWKRRAGGSSIADAQACQDATEIVRSLDSDGRLALGWRWLEDREPNWGVSVSFDIEMPDDRPMSVRTHNGSVRVHGVKAKVDAHTHNGSVQIHGCASPVNVVTHNGSVKIEGCNERVDARTHNGSIGVSGNAATVMLRTHNGGIKANVAEASSLRGEVRTHNGGIELAIPEDNFEIEAKSRSRVVRSARGNWGEVGKNKPKHFRARSGNPEGKLKVRTHNGRIRLR